jgi:hypothetical protein
MHPSYIYAQIFRLSDREKKEHAAGAAPRVDIYIDTPNPTLMSTPKD